MPQDLILSARLGEMAGVRRCRTGRVSLECAEESRGLAIIGGGDWLGCCELSLMDQANATMLSHDELGTRNRISANHGSFA